MRRLFTWVSVLLLAAGVVVPSATANTTCAAVQTVSVNASEADDISDFLGVTGEARFYQFRVTVGKSYSVIVTTPFDDNDDALASNGVTLTNPDPIADLSDTCFGTIFATNDDAAATDPHVSFSSSRINFIATTAALGGSIGSSDDVFLRVTGFAGRFSFSVTPQMIETTVYGAPYFTAFDFDTFITLQNTTRTGVNATVTFIDVGNPATRFSTTIPVPANGSTVISTRAVAPVATTTQGSVQIAHDGPPGALNVLGVSSSATSGQVFQVPFKQRGIW